MNVLRIWSVQRNQMTIEEDRIDYLNNKKDLLFNERQLEEMRYKQFSLEMDIYILEKDCKELRRKISLYEES